MCEKIFSKGLEIPSQQLKIEKKKILGLFDFCMFILIIIPSSVIFTVGTWDTSALLEKRYSKIIPIFGVVIYLVMNLTQKLSYDIARHFLKSKVTFCAFTKFYIYVFATSSVSQWYYVWVGANKIEIFNRFSFVFYTTFGFGVGLFFCKRLVNIIGGHSAHVEDNSLEDVFLFPTMFDTKWKKNKLLYILDSIFSVFIVGTLVILVWRGAWCLLDHTIYPGETDYELSGWISLAIGYSIVFATFALQRLMKILIRKYHGWKRLVIIDTYVVVSFCGTINIWRGIWILLEIYAKLETSLLNCVLLHFLSFFILVIFNSSNTLLVRGVYIDAEENGEDCVEFPCYYFRLRFQERQKKKTLVELNMMVDNKTNNLQDKDSAAALATDISAKKPHTEIVTEINPQQVPLIEAAPNSNGDVSAKITNQDDKCNL